MSKRRVFRLETKHQPLATRKTFARRIAANFGVATLLVALSLGAGMMGYRHLEGMSWVDAFVNAAMILSGMGPISTLQTDAGKIFAGCYALYCGLVLVLSTAIVLAPAVHRTMHRFHVECDTRD